MNTIKDVQATIQTGISYPKYDKLWASDKIKNHNLNGVFLLQNNETLKKYRDLDNNIYNSRLYAKIFGTKNNYAQKSCEQENELTYKNTDFKHSPIIYSLLQLVDSRIANINHAIEINGQDKITVDKKVRIKERLKAREKVVRMLNYIDSLTSNKRTNYDDDLSPKSSKGNEQDFITQIRIELTDNIELEMAQQAGALKDSVEMAQEMSCNQHIQLLEIESNYSNYFAKDLRHAKTICGRLYARRDNGLLEFQYFDPINVKTNKFKNIYGKDIHSVSTEFTCSFGEFIDMVGHKMSPKEIIDIYYLLNSKVINDASYYNFAQNSSYLNDQVKLGYAEFVVHEYNESTKKYYDVTKAIYYIPTLSQGYQGVSIGSTYIIDISDLKDAFRYGENFKETKTSYIIAQDKRDSMSIMDIVWSDYEKLNVIHQELLNTFSAHVPAGNIYVYETVEEMAKLLTEDIMNTDGEDITSENINLKIMELIQQFRARGTGIQKVKSGEADDGGMMQKLVMSGADNRAIQQTSTLIQLELQMYAVMLMGIGVNQNSLGQDPPPRTSLNGLRMANQSSGIATNKYVDMYQNFIVELAQRIVFWNKVVVSNDFTKTGEPKTYRAKFLKTIIGENGIDYIELYNDIVGQDASVTIDNADYTQRFEFVKQLGAMSYQQGKIDLSALISLNSIKNVKYAELYLKAAEAKKRRKDIEMQMEVNKNNSEMQQQQLQQQLAIEKQRKLDTVEADAELKQMDSDNYLANQIAIKKQIAENKREAELLKAQLEENKNIYS